MAIQSSLSFQTCLVDDLTIQDERSFRGVELYGALKEVLRAAKYPFRILPRALAGRWDRALLLNLTYWGAEAGGDVLVDALDADVLAHAAWHHLASRAMPADSGAPSPRVLFLGESIASAFDVYLVGRLIGTAPKSTFLTTQVPAMAEAAMAAGLPEDDFEGLLNRIAKSPELAFEELRELLFDATCALYESDSAEAAMTALARFDSHPYVSLLHHYELSNWVLYARAYAGDAGDDRARAFDRTLREAGEGALEWLTKNWVESRRGLTS